MRPENDYLKPMLKHDLPLGKLLLGLQYISEGPPKTDLQNFYRQVSANLCKFGVERRLNSNGCGQFVAWNKLVNEPQSSQLTQLFTTTHDSQETFKVDNSIVAKFIIGKTYFIIGIDSALFSSVNFFNDVYNLISYRKARVELRVYMFGRLSSHKLSDFETRDHGYQLTPLHPELCRLADFLRSICSVGQSKESSVGGGGGSDDAQSDDLALWKVWNWSLNNYTYHAIENEEEMYNCSIYRPNGNMIEDNLSDGYHNQGDGWDLEPRVYTKEVILSLRDSPYSRKKPENVDNINSLVKSYNGYHTSPHIDEIEEETREYSRKFLLSLRYAPMSLRRPVCISNSSFNNRLRCFKQVKQAAYRQMEKDPMMTLWFSPMSGRRRFDRFNKLNCALHGLYKHY